MRQQSHGLQSMVTIANNSTTNSIVFYSKSPLEPSIAMKVIAALLSLSSMA